MECLEKQYQLLQTYNFNEPTTSSHENYEILHSSNPGTAYQTISASSPTNISQQGVEFNNSSLCNCQETPIVVEETKARKNLGYSVYAENFNKLLQRGSCTSRRKSTIRADGEEEDVVYYGTETSDHYGIEIDEINSLETISEPVSEHVERDIAQTHSSSNEGNSATAYCSSDTSFTSANISSQGTLSSTKLEQNSDAERFKTKPAISYATLVALALKNSKNGCLTVQEVYDFVDSNFPFFRTANSGWKNSVRHNLSFSKYFMKIETRRGEGDSRRSYIWTVDPARSHELEQSLAKLMERDKENTLRCLANPEDFDAIRTGTLNFKFKRPVRRKPMMQIGSRDTSLSRKINTTTNRQEGKANHITSLSSSAQFTYSNTAEKIHTFRGPRRVLSFGATPSAGISEAQGFSVSCPEGHEQYDSRPLPELSKLLNENEDEFIFSQSSQGSSSVFTVTRYQSSPDVCSSFENPTVDSKQTRKTEISVCNDLSRVNLVDRIKGKHNDCQEVYHSASQMSLPETQVEAQVQLTPPRKAYSENWDDVSSIVSSGNDVMLSDAIVNRSPEQDLKLPAFDQWQYEPVTPSRWTDFGGPCRTPQYKVARGHLLV